MSTVYCKRLRMEIDLRWVGPPAPLPAPFVWAPWGDGLLQEHAAVLVRSFHAELDARIFPSLASLDGCIQLMKLIRLNPGFLAAATWLLVSPRGACGSIQGIGEASGFGAVQNLGVSPRFRGLGLGRALLLKALHGFRQSGFKRACLEVSARNRRAIRLYHQVGFIAKRTLYRELIQEPQLEFSI